MSKSWRPCGYVAVDKNKNSVVVCLRGCGEKRYYWAELSELLDAVKKGSGYAVLYEKAR